MINAYLGACTFSWDFEIFAGIACPLQPFISTVNRLRSPVVFFWSLDPFESLLKFFLELSVMPAHIISDTIILYFGTFKDEFVHLILPIYL